MNNAKQIATILIQDGYGKTLETENGAIMALEEDLDYSEEEAVAIAKFVVKEAKNLKSK